MGSNMKSNTADSSKVRYNNHGAARRQSYTGNELLQEQMMREKDKATKLKANIVSAQGLITLPEDIADNGSYAAAGRRTKRRSAQSLSLHERLQNLVAEDKGVEHGNKLDWDNRSTCSSATDDSEFRAIYNRSSASSRASKNGKDRTAQVTKDRPLRVAMGPQGI
jgi:hypothetical protein